MKSKDLKALSKSDLEKKILELKTELIKINSQIKSGTVPENPGKVKNVKKNIARIKTIFNEVKQ